MFEICLHIINSLTERTNIFRFCGIQFGLKLWGILSFRKRVCVRGGGLGFLIMVRGLKLSGLDEVWIQDAAIYVYVYMYNYKIICYRKSYCRIIKIFVSME